MHLMGEQRGPEAAVDASYPPLRQRGNVDLLLRGNEDDNAGACDEADKQLFQDILRMISMIL